MNYYAIVYVQYRGFDSDIINVSDAAHLVKVVDSLRDTDSLAVRYTVYLKSETYFSRKDWIREE